MASATPPPPPGGGGFPPGFDPSKYDPAAPPMGVPTPPPGAPGPEAGGLGGLGSFGGLAGSPPAVPPAADFGSLSSPSASAPGMGAPPPPSQDLPGTGGLGISSPPVPTAPPAPGLDPFGPPPMAGGGAAPPPAPGMGGLGIPSAPDAPPPPMPGAGLITSTPPNPPSSPKPSPSPSSSTPSNPPQTGVPEAVAPALPEAMPSASPAQGPEAASAPAAEAGKAKPGAKPKAMPKPSGGAKLPRFYKAGNIAWSFEQQPNFVPENFLKIRNKSQAWYYKVTTLFMLVLIGSAFYGAYLGYEYYERYMEEQTYTEQLNVARREFTMAQNKARTLSKNINNIEKRVAYETIRQSVAHHLFEFARRLPKDFYVQSINVTVEEVAKDKSNSMVTPSQLDASASVYSMGHVLTIKGKVIGTSPRATETALVESFADMKGFRVSQVQTMADGEGVDVSFEYKHGRDFIFAEEPTEILRSDSGPTRIRK